MSTLAGHSWQEVVAVLEKVGFTFDREHGHLVYIRKEPAPFRRAVVPKHREIKKGTLRRIIRDAGLEVEQFLDILDSR